MEIKIKMLTPDARMPKRAYEGDAGFDVYLPRETVVMPGRNKIPLDFALEMPKWFQAQIEPKSGNSSKGISGFRRLHGSLYDKKADRYDIDILVGKVDANFRGNIHVIVKNCERIPIKLEKGLKIAQMTFYELPHVECLALTDTLTQSERGEQGFGSSGTK